MKKTAVILLLFCLLLTVVGCAQDTTFHPLYDKNMDLVGWLQPGQNIFNTDMEWVAYIADGNAWSTYTSDWIGPVNGLVCLDTDGKVVAWCPGGRLAGSSRPTRPNRPNQPDNPGLQSMQSMPSRPSIPSIPSGGWSSLTGYEWFYQ